MAPGAGGRRALPRPLSAADVEELRALYDGKVRFVDEQLGRFFDELRRSGLYDRSLIVVTADHGDGFMEHGFISHSTVAYGKWSACRS